MGTGADPEIPEHILAAHPSAAVGADASRDAPEAHRTADSIRMIVTRALSFMADPARRGSVLAGPGEGFGVPEFVRGPGPCT